MKKKKFTIQIDQNSWSNSSVPSELMVVNNTEMEIDLLEALHFIGILTRPPVLHGFSLSDFWAWLRYLPAFDQNSDDARFRAEWRALDAHQKTIASDDLGMGFSTLFLKNILGIQYYADTIHVINSLSRGTFSYINAPKRGPKKTPDFIAYHLNGEVSIVECKGTQMSQNILLEAMDRGVTQKNNLNYSSTNFKHRLVAGTFIPQYDNIQRPLIAIKDPNWEIEKEFEKYKKEEIYNSVIQLSFAKELSHVELTNISKSFSKTYEEEENLDSAFEKDRKNFKDKGFQEQVDRYIKEFILKWDVPLIVKGKEYTGIKYTAELSKDKLEDIRNSKTGSNYIAMHKNKLINEHWKKKEVDAESNSYETESPLGVKYKLEII